MVTEYENLRNNLARSSPNCEAALIKIKNAVIGSNRQKDFLIKEGFVPMLLNLYCDTETNLNIRINALIILGSLARSSADQVKILITDYDTVQVLVQQIFLQDNYKTIIELSLSMLRSIAVHSFATIDLYFSDIHSLSHLLRLSSSGSTVETQVSVASILLSLCQSVKLHMLLFQAGTIQALARMICSTHEDIQLPALRSLACLCYENRTISDNVCVTSVRGTSLPDIISMMTSPSINVEIQLIASRCLTNVYRSGTLPSSDCRLVYKVLPCLARLCTDDYIQSTRASAAEAMGYLIEVDPNLQKLAAISNNLMRNLSQLLQQNLPFPKQASFRCFASLAANDEEIRKKIVATNGFIETLINSLDDIDMQVKLSCIRCLHSLSRSVQQLRTTFQDYPIWQTLISLANNQSSNDILIGITSIMCNLVLEFSPSKEPMLKVGIVDIVCKFIESDDPALRLNATWALMNMSFKATQQMKMKIINSVGINTILKLLRDAENKIVMKTLGLLRNLLSNSLNIDYIMSTHSVEVIRAMNTILSSDQSCEIKEQALCIIGNIAADAKERDFIMDDESIMVRLGDFLDHQDLNLQSSALYILNNIALRRDSWSKERYFRLYKLDIISKLLELNKKACKDNFCSADYTFRTLKQIAIECKRSSATIKKE